MTVGAGDCVGAGIWRQASRGSRDPPALSRDSPILSLRASLPPHHHTTPLTHALCATRGGARALMPFIGDGNINLEVVSVAAGRSVLGAVAS
jgi:hypothetical protein